VLDHDDGIGAARQRDRRSQSAWPFPDSTGRVGAVPQAMISSFSMRRTCVASPAGARSAERTAKAVDIGTVERRHVDRRHDILRQARSRLRRTMASGSLGTGARKQCGFENRTKASSRERMVRN